MSMDVLQLFGWVLDVTENLLGSVAEGDHPVGESVITVSDAVDFEEDGGWVLLGAATTPVEYESADLDADTITLVEPLEVALEDGDDVRAWDVELGGVGMEVRALVEVVTDEDGDDDPIDASISHSLVDRIPVGPRTDRGEVVIVQRIDDGAWRVVDLQGVNLTVDGRWLTPGSVPMDPQLLLDLAENQEKLDQLQLDLTEAETAVQQAQGELALVAAQLEDMRIGTNRVWHQPDEPAITGEEIVGDLWFDSDDGYKMHRWDGDEWVAAEFGAPAIGPDSISAAHIAAQTITAAEIAAGAIVADKLAANAVTADKIISGAITTLKLAASAVTASKIAAGAVTTTKLAAGAVTANEIAAGAITVDHLAAGAIDGHVITGAQIRTAATGERVEITSAAPFRAFDSTGAERVTIDDGQLVLKGGTGAAFFGTDSSSTLIEANKDLIVHGNTGLELVASNGSIDMWTAIAGAVRINGGQPAYFDTAYMRSPGTAGLTTTAAANVFINATAHNFARSTSVRAAKVAIEPITQEELGGLLDLEVLTWFDRTAAEMYAQALETEDEEERQRLMADMTVDLRRVPGLVAEDVEVCAPRFATYDGEGNLVGVAYDRIGVAWIPLVKELFNRIAVLEGAQG